MNPMNYETLRVLFERLCDYLEDDSDLYRFQFQGGFGFESPQEVVMVFVFEELAIVFRFPASSFDQLEESSAQEEKRPLSADECLTMTEALQACSGGFQDLFSVSSE